jgi:DnaJ-class molecular chaperone
MPRAEALKSLGLTAAASAEEIKVAYKAMVKKWHPDKHQEADRATVQARFLEIQAAWEALKPGK